MGCLVLDGRFHPVFFHEPDIFLLTVSGHSEQFVVTVYEGLFCSCLVGTGALVAADNVPDEAVTLAQVLPDGIFPVRMRFVIAAGEVYAGYGQPPCLQGMHVRAQPVCRVIPVSPGTDGFQEFLRAEFRPVDSCNDITVAPAVTSDDEAAVRKEIHVGFPAAYTSVFFLYEESTFYRLETFQALQTDPDAVLVIGTDSGHPPVFMVVSDNHRFRDKVGCIRAGLAAVYLVHVCHDTGVASPVAFDRVDIAVPVFPVRNPHAAEFVRDKPGHPLLPA